jgi:cytosine/adenosine deaminase-related metal-dependent hydrolase
LDLEGRFVTPGLVDLHSHHLAFAWPLLKATDDTNEVNPETGPLTPQVRIIDSLKAYDIATTIIASGGVTTSLILPGSANIMGGEAVLVKNALRSGENSEEVVEEILLEHGTLVSHRRRYMKMACGENPRRVYKHTRMGNAWYFRKHMERAKELMGKQDAWCLQAAALKESGNAAAISSFMESTSKDESATEYLEYDSSIGMLRRKVGINVHCYETEDFEDMIHHSKEFGFRIQAFHHALDAWEVPELIKASGE